MPSIIEGMNATQLLRSLDAEQIRKRLRDMEAERKSLLVLLRAARQRERALSPRLGSQLEGRQG
jgi:hypothetical protein